MEDKSIKNIIIIIILLSLTAVLMLVYQFSAGQQLATSQKAVAIQKSNTKTVLFTKLLIKKVLQSKEEVDFETRLQLENAIRTLDDQAILAKWNSFVNSETDKQSQAEIKDLLDMLINKILIIE